MPLDDTDTTRELSPEDKVYDLLEPWARDNYVLGARRREALQARFRRLADIGRNREYLTAEDINEIEELGDMLTVSLDLNSELTKRAVLFGAHGTERGLLFEICGDLYDDVRT